MKPKGPSDSLVEKHCYFLVQMNNCFLFSYNKWKMRYWNTNSSKVQIINNTLDTCNKNNIIVLHSFLQFDNTSIARTFLLIMWSEIDAWWNLNIWSRLGPRYGRSNYSLQWSFTTFLSYSNFLFHGVKGNMEIRGRVSILKQRRLVVLLNLKYST